MRRGDPGASDLSNFGRYYDPDPEYDPCRMADPAPGDPMSLNFATIAFLDDLSNVSYFIRYDLRGHRGRSEAAEAAPRPPRPLRGQHIFG